MVHAFLNTAMMAADEAGKHLVQMSKRLSDLKVDAKGYNNLVSNADHAAEKIIVEKIQTAYPDHAIVAEESGRLGSESSEIVWVIDPLDGTFNYLHGFPPLFCFLSPVWLGGNLSMDLFLIQ